MPCCRLIEYTHGGRTVMVDDEELGAIWVQGGYVIHISSHRAHSPGGSFLANPGQSRDSSWCPVDDVSPFELLSGQGAPQQLRILEGDDEVSMESEQEQQQEQEAWALVEKALSLGAKGLVGVRSLIDLSCRWIRRK